jgi:HEAT repeat protein
LGTIGAASAGPGLIQALGDGEKDVRRAACEALGKIGDASAVPGLIQALGDGEKDVRRAACEALVQIGQPALPELQGALQSPNPVVRDLARKALGRIQQTQR